MNCATTPMFRVILCLSEFTQKLLFTNMFIAFPQGLSKPSLTTRINYSKKQWFPLNSLIRFKHLSSVSVCLSICPFTPVFSFSKHLSNVCFESECVQELDVSLLNNQGSLGFFEGQKETSESQTPAGRGTWLPSKGRGPPLRTAFNDSQDAGFGDWVDLLKLILKHL